MADDNNDNAVFELIKGTGQFLSDRFSSPIVYTFLFSWFIWNHEYILILLSDAPIETKLQLMHEYLFSPSYSYILYGVLVPLASTFLWIYAYPLLARPILNYANKKRLEILKDKYLAERRELSTPEYVESLKLRHFNREEKYKEQISNIEDQLSQQQSVINSLQEEIRAKNETIRARDEQIQKINAPPTPLDLTKEEKQLITLLAQSENDGKPFVHSDLDLVSTSKANFILLKSGLLNLVKLKLVKRVRAKEATQYILTDLGRQFLIEIIFSKK